MGTRAEQRADRAAVRRAVRQAVLAQHVSDGIWAQVRSDVRGGCCNALPEQLLPMMNNCCR